MKNNGLKNIPFSSIVDLEKLVEFRPGQIVSMTLAQNSAVSITLFAFEKDEEISTHESEGDALVTALDGVAEITIEGEKFILKKGETIVMPARKPHAVRATEQFKMLLVVVF